MHARDNAYSRFVGLAKVLLPLVGLVLLSTLFLIARSPSSVTGIPFAEIEEIAREQRVSAPRFAGSTPSGAAVAVEAARLAPQPDTPERYTVEAPRAEIEMPDGGPRYEMQAPSGEIDATTRRLELQGLVRLVTSDGYEMETAGLTADLGEGRLVATQRLEIRAPFGALEAGRMEADGTEGAGRLLFSDGVRLLYRPGEEGEPR
ncbi:LPS export ABC transporter periplasmic protein LptC [Limimaricola pyoseonensis]|uniref:Lipopolysaccharide export system protein LptC n=1 Tax=Limimaricola pyoseonensis TaxID=521013 RepID=A0A1G7EU05_9RHOB|nr:LPS export ABC transporter periplasmic protein LptC [Limimaricola pyoseonensis]SDE67128.1 lipopolysaccharide export system protein LptC [Limimaricola pyoseonensis]